MRYGLHLLPDAFLLLALLRMTFVGLAAQRRAMFFFLCAWLIYSFAALFLGQVWKVDSPQYALRFFFLSLLTWLCGIPALWIASRTVIRSLPHAAVVLFVLLAASLASHFAMANSSMSPIAKLLATNCWIAVIFASVFWFASVGAESPDLYLWRCSGVFFLLFGFGYLFIGMLRPGAWAYVCLVLAATVVWVALAWYIEPNRERLFNPEKLALVPAFRLRIYANREMGVPRVHGNG
jgi:hypothetical protein